MRDVVLVEEAQITDAMRWLLVHEHVLVEGSAAVGVAALLGGMRPDGRASRGAADGPQRGGVGAATIRPRLDLDEEHL